NGEIPSPKELHLFIDELTLIDDVIASDSELSTFWSPHWERESGISVRDSIGLVQKELRQDLSRVTGILDTGSAPKYEQAIAEIGGFDDAVRGSATKTAILAAVAAWAF